MSKSRAARKRNRVGRPRKASARHACGKLVQKVIAEPIKPNEAVIQLRRSLLPNGDITMAENWPDLCLARGWLTEERHRALSQYVGLYQRAGVNIPRVHTFDPNRVRSFDGELGDSGAQDKLRTIWSRLPARRAQVLFAATQNCPQWVVFLIRGRPIPSPFDIDQANLFAALDVVNEVLERPARRVA